MKLSDLEDPMCSMCGRPASKAGGDGESYCNICIRESEPSFKPKSKSGFNNLCRCGSGIMEKYCCTRERRK